MLVLGLLIIVEILLLYFIYQLLTMIAIIFSGLDSKIFVV